MKILKFIGLGIFLLLVGIQFFHPDKNISVEPSSNNIAMLYPVPKDVKDILMKACNDCHSNNTRYPWYNNIQPVAWWLNDHVKDGKRHLNFDEFATYRISRQFKKLEECIDEVKESNMPLLSYKWAHKDARLTQEEKLLFTNWCEMLRDSISAKYPADSLIAPKKK